MSKYCQECDIAIDFANINICTTCGSNLIIPGNNSNDESQTNINNTIDTNLLFQSVNNLYDILGDDLRQLISNTSPNRQVSIDYLDKVSKIPIDNNKSILFESYLTINNNINILTILSSFCNQINDIKISGQMIICDPIYGEGPLTNNYQDKILFMKRGKISFKEKAIKAQLVNVKALVIMQDSDKWPFVMTDNSTIDFTITIPVIMISKNDSEILINILNKPKQLLNGLLTFNSLVKECSICQDDFNIDQLVVKLDCRHVYHYDCLHSWLSIHNTCPMCRYQLPSSETINSNESIDPRDDAWRRNGTII